MAKNTNKDLFVHRQEKREFIDGLRLFHNSRGTPFDRIPKLGKEEVDLYLLYRKVTSLGGWKKVTEEQRWNELYEDFKLPRFCINTDQALKYIYIRYLNVYEQIHFLGEDPKTLDARREDEGPIRKKLCGPQYSVPLSYNYNQHSVAEHLRSSYGLAVSYAKFSDYDKLEKALLSGLPNEVDFVINVCTLLSNESKHSLRLEKSIILTDLLLAHIGIFHEGPASMEDLYENGWRKCSNMDFIRFWFETIENEAIRKLISYTRLDAKDCMAGMEVLQLGRNLGVEDREGIRITQVAIILRNLSFEDGNMKFLASSELVFRFLLLCVHCSYGTLRQLALDTLGNLAAQFILEPVDSFRSRTVLGLLQECITSKDKFAVVRGLEMVSKLSRLDDNEYVLSEKLDTYIYEEIGKYLTIQDIQLIVASLEALYQLSEIGEETNSKIVEASNTVDTLVGLITVEAQSYGPNSLVGIKVVEYCPPPHFGSGVPDDPPGATGQPPGSGTSQSSAAAQQAKSKSVAVPASKGAMTGHLSGPSQMETTTCNWLQATYEVFEGAFTESHITLYSEYLSFCKKFQLPHALSSQNFLRAKKIVFPRVKNVMRSKPDGGKEMCVLGIRKRQNQLPFSISCPVSQPRSSVTSTTPTIRPNSAIHSPTLLQRLAAGPALPPLRALASNPPVYPAGVPVQQVAATSTSNQSTSQCPSNSSTATLSTYSLSGGIVAQGFTTDTLLPPPPTTVPVAVPIPTTATTIIKPKPVKKKGGKKHQPILPRPEPPSGNHPAIAPKVAGTPTPQPQQQLMQNVQYTSYPQEIVYQTIDPQNSEAKVMVKTLLAKKIRQGTNVIIQQPLQGVMNVDMGGGGDGQTVQYQTTYAQSVPQATYIQYATPTNNTQTVQTLFQTGQASQMQTYVVQPDAVYVQNQLQSSSLNTQIVAQPPLVVAQQQQILPQQQIITQPGTMISQPSIIGQPQVMPQSQIITQSPQTISQSQVIPQTVLISQPQVISQSQLASNISTFQTTAFPLSSSAAIQSSEMSAFVTTVSSSSSMDHSSSGVLESDSITTSQTGVISSGSLSQQTDSFPNTDSNCSKPETDFQMCAEANMEKAALTDESLAEIQNVESKSSEKTVVESIPSITEHQETQNTNESELNLSSSEAVAEIESAVDSIMGMGNDMEEEPVMIENDGNELMFEQKYQGVTNDVDNREMMYGQDEAADAVNQLEQMEQETEVSNDTQSQEGIMLSVNGTNKPNDEDHQIQTESVDENGYCDEIENMDIQNDDHLMSVDQNEMDENELKDTIEDIKSDSEVIAKFRAETPIIVPSITENGLFEQDFEARMAVENLLKDVEFNVNGDDSLEENVNFFSCGQQENPGSVRTDSPSEAGVPGGGDDSRDSATSESQTVTKNKHLNHNGTAPSANKPAQSIQYMSHNGINNDHKPLMNGNISSPEYQSVSSPNLNGGDCSKLVNGIEDEKNTVFKNVDKISRLNGVVNHKIPPKGIDVCNVRTTDSEVKAGFDSPGVNCKMEKVNDILAQSIIDCKIEKSGDFVSQSLSESKLLEDKSSTVTKTNGDILAQSILENDIQASDCDILDPEPTSVAAVVKQMIPSTMYGNIMTVQINNNSIPITFTNNTIISSKNSLSNPNNVCNSRHIPTPESSRDAELSCDSTTSSIATSDLNIVVSDKHSIVTQPKLSHKDSNKVLLSPKPAESSKKSKPKKRSRSKSGGSGGNVDSRPSSVPSPAPTPAPAPEYMCEWSQCRRCFDNAKSVFCHICSVHLKTEFDGLCKWEGCETIVRKRWSLFTHVQDHHCSESSLRVAAQRRLQAIQMGQPIASPSIPAMIYLPDAASQAIKRFLPKPPYTELTEGREGPVTKHIRLTSALILRNVAKYSPAGRSLLKKHERAISYVCMSAVESSTALANCLYEIIQDH